MLLRLSSDVLFLIASFIDGRALRASCRSTRRAIPKASVAVHAWVCPLRIDAGQLVHLEAQGAVFQSPVSMHHGNEASVLNLCYVADDGHRHYQMALLRTLHSFRCLSVLRLRLDDSAVDLPLLAEAIHGLSLQELSLGLSLRSDELPVGA